MTNPTKDEVREAVEWLERLAGSHALGPASCKNAQTVLAALAEADAISEMLEDARLKITVLEEMLDRIHDDIMTNGPRCTCGEGDEWCARCAKSEKLSRIAERALAKHATPSPSVDAKPSVETSGAGDAAIETMSTAQKLEEIEKHNVALRLLYASLPSTKECIATIDCRPDAAMRQDAKGATK